MNSFNSAVFLALSVLLIACSSAPTPQMAFHKLTPVDRNPSGLTAMNLTQQKMLVQEEINKLMLECRPVLTNFEDDTRNGSKLAFYISMTGLIAGSVAAPALIAANASANASSIAALSGLAGATNTASEVLKTSGLDGTYAAQDRNEIITRIRGHLQNVFSGSNSVEEKLNYIALAKAECALYMITVPSFAPIAIGSGEKEESAGQNDQRALE